MLNAFQLIYEFKSLYTSISYLQILTQDRLKHISIVNLFINHLSYTHQTMDKLPNEIIREIFSYLRSKTDLTNFRLVHSSFSAAGNDILFKTVRIKPTESSVQSLLEVVRRGGLACYVKKVILHLEDFRHAIWLPVRGLLSPEKSRDQNSLLLRNLLAEFNDFEGSGDYPTLFACLFAILPHLEDIQIKQMPSRGYPDIVTSREMMTYSHMTNDVLYLKLHLGGNLLSQQGGYRAFRAFIDAAFFARAKLVSFQTNAELSLTPQQNKVLERATQVFQHCAVFDLELCQGDSSLLNILPSALKLKKLRLNLRRNEIHHSDGGSLCFFKIIEVGCIWPCLMELDIKGLFISNQDSFLGFLQQHHGTLQRLSLQNCRIQLLRGSWEEVARVMKNTLKLERLQLRELSDYNCFLLQHSYSMEELRDMVRNVLG